MHSQSRIMFAPTIFTHLPSFCGQIQNGTILYKSFLKLNLLFVLLTIQNWDESLTNGFWFQLAKLTFQAKINNFDQLIIKCILHQLPHHHLLSLSFLSYPSFLSCLSSCPFCLSFLSCLSSFCLHPTVAIRKEYMYIWQNLYTCKIIGRHMYIYTCCMKDFKNREMTYFISFITKFKIITLNMHTLNCNKLSKMIEYWQLKIPTSGLFQNRLYI